MGDAKYLKDQDACGRTPKSGPPSQTGYISRCTVTADDRRAMEKRIAKRRAKKYR